MLLKSAPGVNFMNILHAPFLFLYKNAFQSFSLSRVWFCDFWQKNIDTNAACKMLMKLTTAIGPQLHNDKLQ